MVVKVRIEVGRIFSLTRTDSDQSQFRMFSKDKYVETDQSELTNHRKPLEARILSINIFLFLIFINCNG